MGNVSRIWHLMVCAEFHAQRCVNEIPGPCVAYLSWGYGVMEPRAIKFRLYRLVFL
uniref:Uncharacterized protein n=1 Tax=Physcomitrium patens TaxID=3218 RepID=A0A2K1IX97_PHYPA|nr:hypothetical protein PHYPA_023719 [Physcomitrium patens]